MYKVLETLTAPRVNRWVVQSVIRCDTYEEACQWARFLSSFRHDGIPIRARYHVLAAPAQVLYSTP